MTVSDPRPATPNNGGIDPFSILKEARIAVPALDYALGAAGVAAAAAIILMFIGSYGQAGYIIIGSVFIAMFLIFAFSQLIKTDSGRIPGIVLLWMVVVFFGFFLVFTITAFIWHVPEAWSDILKITNSSQLSSQWSLENCPTEESLALANFNQNSDDDIHATNLINCKNPMGYNLKGEVKFYNSNYSDATYYFEQAINELNKPTINPSQSVTLASWQANLASAYVETNKISDAITILKKVLTDYPSRNDFRLALADAQVTGGIDENSLYKAALVTLSGIDTNYLTGDVRRGRPQIVAAAANVGISQTLHQTQEEVESALKEANKNLCDAFQKMGTSGVAFWPNRGRTNGLL